LKFLGAVVSMVTEKRRGLRLMSFPVVVAVFAVSAASALAAITSTSGAVVKHTPPANVGENALSSDTQIVAFDEQQCVTLPSNLAVDITPGGGAGVIPAGTKVSSQFLDFDPTGGPLVTLSGSVTTDASVLGVITSSGNLSASDSLGAPGTAYPTGNTIRGLEGPGPAPADGDTASISSSNTVTVALKDRFHFDQVRVISACSPPPPPPKKQHCNSGRGNGSEGCDPGNSSTSSNGSTGQNQGGDEGGPIHGGTGAP
jgi:hypothetical protein